MCPFNFTHPYFTVTLTFFHSFVAFVLLHIIFAQARCANIKGARILMGKRYYDKNLRNSVFSILRKDLKKKSYGKKFSSSRFFWTHFSVKIFFGKKYFFYFFLDVFLFSEKYFFWKIFFRKKFCRGKFFSRKKIKKKSF